jgi:hypothetical protein
LFLWFEDTEIWFGRVRVRNVVVPVGGVAVKTDVRRVTKSRGSQKAPKAKRVRRVKEKRQGLNIPGGGELQLGALLYEEGTVTQQVV